jgi:hypothetical protein
MEIRRATLNDSAELWALFTAVVESGDAFVYDVGMSKEAFVGLWLGPSVSAYVFEDEGLILGTYILKSNHVGRGATWQMPHLWFRCQHEVKGWGRCWVRIV